MSDLEVVNVATKAVSEAKHCLDVQHRNNLITQSYLGELTHQQILEKQIIEIDKALKVLKSLRPNEYNMYLPIKEDLEKELDLMKPKPKIHIEPTVKTTIKPTKAFKPAIKTTKKRGRKK